jgi:hypothetical protein
VSAAEHRTKQAKAWALRLPAPATDVLSRLRLQPGVELGEAGGELWLKGPEADETLAGLLRGLPATARFEVLPDGRLRPSGAVLAVERLPELRWIPLREWLELEWPVARLAADAPPPVQLELEPSHAARAANAALLPLASWLDWLGRAPALRSAPLRFAATTGGRALVLGTPLPALSCRACVEEQGVVVPAGLAWRPAVSAFTVRKTLQAPAGAIVLWEETGVQVLGAELFVAASRGAARATREGRYA